MNTAFAITLDLGCKSGRLALHVGSRRYWALLDLEDFGWGRCTLARCDEQNRTIITRSIGHVHLSSLTPPRRRRRPALSLGRRLLTLIRSSPPPAPHWKRTPRLRIVPAA